MEKPLTSQQEKFAQEVAKGHNLSDAYRASYKVNRMTSKTLNESASRLFANHKIHTRIRELQKAAADVAVMEAAQVIREVSAIASADVRELIEYRIGCCRYCWGDGFRYQRTPAEFQQAELTHSAAMVEAALNSKPFHEFDPEGGIGYNRNKEPNPECPECFGDGVGRTVIKDTSKVSKAVASLFAGIKETQHGIEIKTHDKVAALEKLMRHMGLFELDNEQKVNPLSDLLKELAGAVVKPGKPLNFPQLDDEDEQ